jgi:adenylate cyclase, class 2
MAAIETEIKFPVTDQAELEKKLTALGFTLLTPSSFESNTLYDTPGRDLRARHELIRIRTYAGKCVLTHKRVPEGSDESRHKHRIETETEIGHADALADVFLAAGLVPAFRYEKYRTEWADSQGHCVVDRTPIGTFAELEGPGDWIDHIADQLSIAPGDRMTLSYGRLFDQWRERTGSSVEDLTFTAIPTA